MTFTLTIVGRPNVGKSTLFNRLAGKRLALVDDTPGVTRDRREGEGTLGDLSFKVVDTAGFEEGKEGTLSARMREQTEVALRDADVILFLIDSRAGVTPLDRHFGDILRRAKAPVILCANKCEGRMAEASIYEAYALGLGDPIAISAEHGEGLAEMYTEILGHIQKVGLDNYGEDEEKEVEPIKGPGGDLIEGDFDYAFEDDDVNTDPDKPLRIAIVGRPNSGKSTLINHMIEEDRLVVGPEAGITRDSIGVAWEYEGRPVKLFDTAGLRKKAKVVDKLEKLSVADALRAVKFAEVVVLMVDAQHGLEKQDLKIASVVVQEGRGLVIAYNKWDLIDDPITKIREMQDTLTRSLPQLKGVRAIQFSALTGKGTHKIMPTIIETHELWNTRIATNAVNRWLEGTMDKHPPPAVRGTRLKIRFAAQVKTRPPTIVLFCNRPSDLPDSYLRYMENEFRWAFDLPAVPIRMLLRKGKNPFESRRRKKR